MKYWIMPILGVVAFAAVLVSVMLPADGASDLQVTLLLFAAEYLWPALIATPVLLMVNYFKPSPSAKWLASFSGMFAVYSLLSIGLALLAILELTSHVGAL